VEWVQAQATTQQESSSMPFVVTFAFALISLIGLCVAVVASLRASAHDGQATAASLTYRAYSA
jgi:hypothetical protein